jgi:hypothetical protein
MDFVKIFFRYCTLILFICAAMNAQQTATSSTATVVPRLVNFSGRAISVQGSPVTGIAGITFAIYKDQSGGSPLWIETQNVNSDAKGSYTVQLGATTAEGLPLDLFTSGEARWLGVRVNGGEEQPRVLLLSVPYALKAADAETVGGLPASAFMLAAAPSTAAGSTDVIMNAGANSNTPALAGTGTTDFLPLWTNSTGTLGNSVLFQSGTGSTAKIGINSTTPASTLDVNGAVTARGNLSLPATGTATTTAGKNSQPLTFAASSYNSSTGSAVNQNFRWQAEPTGNDTANASGTLNLLYSVGGNALAETGLKVAKNGQITFAAGQTFPGAGGGTITGITAGTDLTGGGTSGNVTLSLNTATVPQLTSVNAFSALNTFPTVGVGTSSPLANLDVIGGGGLHILAGDPGCGTFAAIGFLTTPLSGCGNYALLGDASGGTYLNASGSSSTIHFRINNGDVNGDAMDILSTNQVIVPGSFLPGIGIGTTPFLPPQAALEVETGNEVAGWFEDDYADNPTIYAYNAAPSSDEAYGFQAGGGVGYCTINILGDLKCTGSKSAVVPVDGGSRKVALYAVEAPENWFEDYGSGQLSNGSVRIDLESTFAQTVNTDLDYHVFLTPNGDCKGLYVSQKSPTSFEVHELGSGTSSVAFDYRIIAKRKNYENIRLADFTKQFKSPEQQRAAMRQHRHAPVPSTSNPAAALEQKPGINTMIEKSARPTQSAALSHGTTK